MESIDNFTEPSLFPRKGKEGEMSNLRLPEGKDEPWDFPLRDMSKNFYSQFFDSQNAFFSNLNTANLKMFLNFDGIYRFSKKLSKYYGRR